MSPTSDESRALFHRLSPGERRTYEKVGRALTEMRFGSSIGEAARATGTTPEAIRRYASPWLLQRPDGAVRALGGDNMLRRLRWPTERGIILIETADSRVASELGEFWNAVGRYLAGDRRALQPYAGRAVRVAGRSYRYPAEEQILTWARRGEVSFETIYDLTD